MERYGDLPRDTQPELVQLGTHPGRQAVPEKQLHQLLCPTSAWSLGPLGWPGGLSHSDPVPQLCLLYPPRLMPRSLWETLTLKTSQETLLRGNGTHGDRKGTWGTDTKAQL